MPDTTADIVRKEFRKLPRTIRLTSTNGMFVGWGLVQTNKAQYVEESDPEAPLPAEMLRWPAIPEEPATNKIVMTALQDHWSSIAPQVLATQEGARRTYLPMLLWDVLDQLASVSGLVRIVDLITAAEMAFLTKVSDTIAETPVRVAAIQPGAAGGPIKHELRHTDFLIAWLLRRLKGQGAFESFDLARLAKALGDG